jgi:Flp pilus assembly protein protease CpaA
MHYDFIPISTVLISVLLVYFSSIDIRTRHLENQHLLPSFIIGISAVFNKLLNSILIYQGLIFLIISIAIGFVFYLIGFFGGADVKIIVILFMIIDPTKTYGITSNLDGIQFYFYFFTILLLFFLIRLVKNLINSIKFPFIKINDMKLREILYLCLICKLQKLYKVKLNNDILMKIDSARINFMFSFTQNGSFYCWTRDHIAMIPFITTSTLLMIFT